MQAAGPLWRGLGSTAARGRSGAAWARVREGWLPWGLALPLAVVLELLWGWRVPWHNTVRCRAGRLLPSVTASLHAGRDVTAPGAGEEFGPTQPAAEPRSSVELEPEADAGLKGPQRCVVDGCKVSLLLACGYLATLSGKLAPQRPS